MKHPRDELMYDCDPTRLGPGLARAYAPLRPDVGLDGWLARWGDRPHGWLETKLAGVLGSRASLYDVHGLLGMYPMHLLSSEAYGELLSAASFGSLLDVGAGAGHVTEHARPLFERVVCTETSRRLAGQLRKRGFTVLQSDLSTHALDETFDVVSCLNVLDRTARPLTLLRALKAHLRPRGRLLLSMPLPAMPHVHVQGGTESQRERLPTLAPDFETAARELTEHMLEPQGLQVERFARTPYLSRGDAHAPLYILDAAIWVCRAADHG